jgi:formyltetrahydrofolate hydrolase
MELTKEHFDEQLGRFVTKEYFDQQLQRFVTKEYFDQQLDRFVTKDHFDQQIQRFVTKENLETTLDKRFDDFEEKMDKKFVAQTKELKEFAEEQTESLARIIATTVAEPLEEVRGEVVKLERTIHRTY